MIQNEAFKLYFSGLWGLVNNAGIMGKLGRVDWQTLNDYRKVASINLFGLIDVAMTFLPLIKKERGRLVNMGTTYSKKYVFKSVTLKGSPTEERFFNLFPFSKHARKDCCRFCTLYYK